LAVSGLLIAAFHLALTVGLIPESLSPCSQGVQCSVTQVRWLGFVTIPLLSLLAFLSVCGLLTASACKKKP
jgi:disulfide bond formation protein DsbB